MLRKEKKAASYEIWENQKPSKTAKFMEKFQVHSVLYGQEKY